MIENSDQKPVSAGNEKRAAANRKNAQKSTGPRTTAGKAKSARNATKYGVWARQGFAVTCGNFEENQGEIWSYIDSIIEDLAPADDFQHALALNVATLFVRLRRLGFMEADALNARGLSGEQNTVRDAASRAERIDAASVASWIINKDDANYDFVRIVPTLLRALAVPDDVLEQGILDGFDVARTRAVAGVDFDDDELANDCAKALAEHILNVTFPKDGDAELWALQYATQAEREFERAVAQRGRQALAALQQDMDKSSQISDRLLRQIERGMAEYRKARGEDGS